MALIELAHDLLLPKLISGTVDMMVSGGPNFFYILTLWFTTGGKPEASGTSSKRLRDIVMFNEDAAAVHQAGRTATAIVGRMGARSRHASASSQALPNHSAKRRRKVR